MATSIWTHLSLGSNVGDRGRCLRTAVAELRAWIETDQWVVSSVYETAFVGDGPRQRDYWNLCLRARVDLEAEEILVRTQSLERQSGRRPGSHGLPRPLDIDLLDHRGRSLHSEWLRLPHPGLADRRFVLEPLFEIDPSLVLPDGRMVKARLQEPSIQGQVLRRLGALECCEDTAAEVAR